MSVGNCSNSHAKLLALWGFIWFSKMRSILEIHIVGASNVFIDLDDDSYSMHTLNLEHWMNRVKLLIHKFSNISFHHIYRVFSMEVDGLSKKAIGDMEGLIFYDLFDEVLLDNGIVCFEVPLSQLVF